MEAGMMNKEEAQMIAFQLIGFAGDAFSFFYKATEGYVFKRKGEN